MNRIALLLGASLLGGCSDGNPPAEHVRAFCEGIRVGEPFAEVRARYGAFRLQPGGFAPAPKARLGGSVPADALSKVAGILLEPAGSPGEERPACAIYYGDPFLAGDGKVILAEFKDVWNRRY